MSDDKVVVTVRISYRGTIVEHTDSVISGNPIFASKEADAILGGVGQRAVSMIAASHGDVRKMEKRR